MRTFIDDVENKVFRYSAYCLYTDGGYHINIFGAKHLDEAKADALLVKEHLHIEKVHSINEGHYGHQ